MPFVITTKPLLVKDDKSFFPGNKWSRIKRYIITKRNGNVLETKVSTHLRVKKFSITILNKDPDKVEKVMCWMKKNHI